MKKALTILSYALAYFQGLISGKELRTWTREEWQHIESDLILCLVGLIGFSMLGFMVYLYFQA